MFNLYDFHSLLPVSCILKLGSDINYIKTSHKIGIIIYNHNNFYGISETWIRPCLSTAVKTDTELETYMQSKNITRRNQRRVAISLI